MAPLLDQKPEMVSSLAALRPSSFGRDDGKGKNRDEAIGHVGNKLFAYSG